MLIAGIAGICVLLFLVAFVAPRLSRGPQSAVDRGLGASANVASKAPGALGRWLAKPFRTSRRAADKSAAAGRKAHEKIS